MNKQDALPLFFEWMLMRNVKKPRLLGYVDVHQWKQSPALGLSAASLLLEIGSHQGKSQLYISSYFTLSNLSTSSSHSHHSPFAHNHSYRHPSHHSRHPTLWRLSNPEFYPQSSLFCYRSNPTSSNLYRSTHLRKSYTRIHRSTFQTLSIPRWSSVCSLDRYQS